jgi:deoxyadenosine/deoxycytidine kinase
VNATLISILGPPAVGKTTLARHLAGELPAGLIAEDYAGNPFLADSYAGQDSARLPAQLYFLLSRVAQLRRSDWPARGQFVSDYGFCQDRIYAQLRLSAEDLRLYDSIAGRMESLVHPPDLAVALDAREATLLYRIAERGRAFERSMTTGFLAAARRAYNNLVDSLGCPVVVVDCDKTDLRWADARAELLAEVRSRLPAGTAATR